LIMMDSKKSLSPAARFPSAVLPVKCSIMQNTCMCLEQNFSKRWRGHPYSHRTLPYDCFLLCATHKQFVVQEENYRILTKWNCILLKKKKNLGKRRNHSTEFHTTMFTYEA
jgi:hypothetical protein